MIGNVAWAPILLLRVGRKETPAQLAADIIRWMQDSPQRPLFIPVYWNKGRLDYEDFKRLNRILEERIPGRYRIVGPDIYFHAFRMNESVPDD